MKIKYFSYITEQSFKTLPNGERVFYFGLPWSKPYVLPDKDIEQRIYKKLLWINRLGLGTMILGQPFLFINIPDIIEKPVWWFAYLFGISFLFWVVSWGILRKDLLQIQRTTTSGTFSSFYYDMAKRHSEGGLVLGLLVSLAFVIVGIWLLFGEINFYIGLANIVLFTAVATGWGYALNIKSTIPSEEKLEEKTDIFGESIRSQNKLDLPNYEVMSILEIANNDEKIVMLKYSQSFSNVLRCKKDGSIIWQAELPNQLDDVYTNIEWRDEKLIAFSRSCVSVVLDENTGTILSGK